jgi:pilus assembly protein CpaC
MLASSRKRAPDSLRPGRQQWRRYLIAGCVLMLLAFSSAGALANGPTLRLDHPDRVGQLRLTIDKSQTHRANRPFAEALVANPEIADVVPLTDQSLYLIGKKVGMTRLTLLDGNKRLLSIFDVEVSYDIAGLRDELRRSVTNGEFRLRTANGRILLSGLVPDAMALAKAIDITEQFTSSCEAHQLKEVSDAVGGKPGPAAGAPGPAPGPQANANANVQRSAPVSKCYVNLLTVRAPQQVSLEVRFVEAQRTAARDLGLSWDARSNRFRGLTGAQPVPITPGVLTAPALISGLPSSSIPFGTFVARLLDNGTQADLIIQALEKKGLARRLAEPNLVTLSGDTANFLAGGEFPFPVQADDRRITLEFKKFGVGLAFTPTVLAEGQINLKIEPEVSDLDPNNAFTLVNGISVPALVVRRASTTVELRDGQSFAIAGLLQTKHIKEQNQLPWIGNVPVLGALFRSASYEKEESDLVIIVTPRLVRPAVPGQQLLTPLDQKLASNDRDFFLRGKHEIPKHYPAPYGHILEVDPWATSTIPEKNHAAYK